MVAFAVVAAPAIAQTPAPSAATGGVSGVAPTVATLTGTVNPHGVATRYFFQYGPRGLSKRTASVAVGSGTDPVQISQQVSDLQPNKLYAYRLVATSDGGTVMGARRDFRTPRESAVTPVVSTGSATNVADTGATLNGAINTRGATGTYQFQYGPSRQYGASTPAAPFGPTTNGTAISSPVGSLAPATTYHYRLVFQPSSGRAVLGRDRTFTTTRIPNGLLIEAKPNPVRYGAGIQVAGVLAGSDNSGVGITVQADTFPFDGNWQNVASGRTDPTGAYVIAVSPMISSSQLRTVAATRPQVISQLTTVGVRLGVSLRVNRHPRRGARVRFRGHVTPSQDGAAVSIQRRVRGTYRTIARTRVNGSSYSRRVRIRSSGRYRALVRPTDGSHVSGNRSRLIRVR
ncbi:hypothetical protein [Capillimicrobium parvum]|uniref:hypothetical protein n=1 Tax=Capillimicrobium parvum TaxID=2884022 RepID=UPI00216ACD6E|nr:hypothetical protein [Capillimicrobium parvum]